MYLDDLAPDIRAKWAEARELMRQLVANCEASGDWTEYDAICEWMELHTLSRN